MPTPKYLSMQPQRFLCLEQRSISSQRLETKTSILKRCQESVKPLGLFQDDVYITIVGLKEHYQSGGINNRGCKTPSPKLGMNTGSPRIFFSVFIL